MRDENEAVFIELDPWVASNSGEITLVDTSFPYSQILTAVKIVRGFMYVIKNTPAQLHLAIMWVFICHFRTLTAD